MNISGLTYFSNYENINFTSCLVEKGYNVVIKIQGRLRKLAVVVKRDVDINLV